MQTPARAPSTSGALAAILALAVLMFALPALGQLRPIPAEAQRAHIRHLEFDTVALNGKPVRLAPGAIIRDQRNLIVFANTLPERGTTADYLLDPQGQVWRVWLLTPEEAARPKPRK